MALPDKPDWHTVLVNKALEGGKSPDELRDYLALRNAEDPVAAFNLFVKRWVHPDWHPHLMNSDDNEAEFVRSAIRLAIAKAACAGFGAGGAAMGNVKGAR